MSRFIALFLTICMLLGAAVFAMNITTSANLYKKGDVNADYKVNAADAFLIKKHISDGTSLPGDADIDGDKVVSTRDILYIKASFVKNVDIDKVCFNGFTVSGQSIDGFKIIVTNPDNANMVFAAEELQSYALKQGYSLSVETTADLPSEKAFIFTEGDFETYGNDGFSISVDGSVVTMTVGALRGSMYCAYTIIEDYFGYRFYGYNSCEIIWDAAKDLADGTVDTQIPKIIVRNNNMESYANRYSFTSVIQNKLSGATVANNILDAKHGYGIYRVFANAHSFEYYISTSPTHCLYDISYDPDYDGTIEYEEEFGVSNLTKCYYNMANVIYQRLARGEEIGKELTEISCSYAADEAYCTCRSCRKISSSQSSYAAVLIRFINAIDDIFDKDFPGMDLVTNAYAAVRKPPQTSDYVLHDDVIVLYCWNGCINHAIGSGECSENPRVVSAFDNELGSNLIEENFFFGWTQHASRFIIWCYPTNIYYMLCPQSNYFNLYNDMKWWADHGVEGFNIAGTSGSAFEDLDSYLMNQMMWNPDMSYDEYIHYMQEYLKYQYGYGWTYIYDYMLMLEECGNLKGCVLNDYDQPFDTYDISYFALHFDEMQALISKAYAVCENDRERNNVNTLSVHMKFLGYSATYEERYVNGTAESRAEFEAGWKWTYNYINNNNIRITYDTRGISNPFTLSVSPMQLVYGISGIR